MKYKDILRIEQLEDTLKPFRQLQHAPTPKGGWVRAIREALGMTSPQLARRLEKKAAQSIEDMQKSEVTGAIQLQTLQKLAVALECRLVYAVVPKKPLQEIRSQRARSVASRRLRSVSHSMKLEDQGLSPADEERQIELMAKELLEKTPRKLWE